MTPRSCVVVGRDAAGEALVVEQLEQGREALGVAVVRRGGEEELVLEVRGERADRLACAASRSRSCPAPGRGDVVGLVDDQQVEAAGVGVARRSAEDVSQTAAAAARA